MSKRVGVMIPHPEVWEEFKKFVEERWGRKYSTMGIELENALKKYMRDVWEYEHTHTRTEEGKQNQGRKQQHEHDSKSGNSVQVAYADAGGLKKNHRKLSIPPSERTKREIIQHLEESGMMEAENISESAVRRIIAQIAGHDKRTIDKYFCILEEEWLLPENMKRKPSCGFARFSHFKR